MVSTYLQHTPTNQAIRGLTQNHSNIFLKLENLQPSGSFKSRGIGNLMYQAMLTKKNAHFYCSSGGNAGLAAATSAAVLSRPCTIVVPMSTSQYMIDKIRRK